MDTIDNFLPFDSLNPTTNQQKTKELFSTLTINKCLNNPKIFKVMDYVSKTIELNDFSFYWWGVLDLALWNNINDIDLAIWWIEDEQIKIINKTLESKEFRIVHPKRYYPISNDSIEVYLVYAKNDHCFFDIAFLKEPSIFGLFNLDSLYCDNLERKCIDKYWALDGFLSKTITPIKPIEWENPLCFFSRFIRLSSKYNIPMIQQNHNKFINEIGERLNNINILENERIFWSTISSIFKAIKKSHDSNIFCNELLETNLLNKVFPELEIAFKNIDTKHLNKIKNRNSIISILENNISWDIKEWFQNKINVLKKRSWE